jgi:monovalent cation/hydrogen antiporter
MYFEMLNSQRAYLIQANQDPTLNEEIVRHQLYLIDLEEERMKLL